MNLQQAYQHCPRCGVKTTPHKEFIECTSCHYKLYLNPAPCNAVIIENHQGEILMVERKFDPHKGEWDLPGGFIKTGESFIDSAKREIKEELQVEIAVGNIIGAYADHYLFQNVDLPTLGIAVVASITHGTIQPADDAASYRFFPKSEILNQQIAFAGVRKGLEDYLKQA
jgi:ADP-ribose pyrophosphatase YjhB (NUDIX family)